MIKIDDISIGWNYKQGSSIKIIILKLKKQNKNPFVHSLSTNRADNFD